MTDYRTKLTSSGYTARKKPKKIAVTGAATEKPAPPTERECSRCHITFPMDRFPKQKGLVCKECVKIAAKQRMRDRQLFSSTYLREYIVGILGGTCARCGYEEFVGALEFHHIDPSLKESNLTKLINIFAYGGTQSQWEAIEREALKCVLLCSNCHQSLHQHAWDNIGEVCQFAPKPTRIPMPIP